MFDARGTTFTVKPHITTFVSSKEVTVTLRFGPEEPSEVSGSQSPTGYSSSAAPEVMGIFVGFSGDM
jgi:hypothetical protein